MFEDYTSFDNWNSNGWETGSGAEFGHVVEQEGKFFWSGRVDMGTLNQFEPALKKVFDIELSPKTFFVEFKYRIRKRPDHGHQFLIAVTIPMHEHLRFNTTVDENTPINVWLGSQVGGSAFFSTSKELWIGLWRNGLTINPPQWEIDFDNISVTERVKRKGGHA